MYETDFNDPQLQNHDLSDFNLNYYYLCKNDRTFLHLTESEATMVDAHYKLPLPFKDRDVTLPNNRVSTVKRIEPLNRRCKKDKQFFKSYKEFMTYN